MLTGGTGSFGNKFVELVLKKYNPKKLIIYSRDEYKQFLMQKKFDPENIAYLLNFDSIYGQPRHKFKVTTNYLNYQLKIYKEFFYHLQILNFF